MTTRILAANAAPLSADDPSRRTLLATAGAAAVLAAIGTGDVDAAEAHPDAALLALRTPYEQTLTVMDLLAKPHNRAEEAYFALKAAEPALDERSRRKRSGLTLAERHYHRATRANLKVIDRIAETPASTVKGIIFKAQVSRREHDMERDLLVSIVTDLIAMGVAA